MVDFKHHLLTVRPPSEAHGFTLVEALVAITILLLGVLGPLSVATRGITDGMIAKNKIVALGLAQEGIELVRAKVKTNLNSIPPLPWLTGLDGSSSGPEDCVYPAPDTCSVDVLSNIYTNCVLSAGTCDLRSNSDGIYVLASTPGVTGQMFQRTIQIVKSSAMGPGFNDSNIEAKVTVTVYWQDKNQNPPPIVLSTYIYNPAIPSS